MKAYIFFLYRNNFDAWMKNRLGANKIRVIFFLLWRNMVFYSNDQVRHIFVDKLTVNIYLLPFVKSRPFQAAEFI